MSGGEPIAFTVNLTEADLTAALLLVALIGTLAAVFEAARKSLLNGQLLLTLEGAVVLMLLYIFDQMLHALPKAQVPRAVLALIRSALAETGVRRLAPSPAVPA